MAGGRDQREPMERLIRVLTALRAAGSDGLSGPRLLAIAGFAESADGTSALARDLRALREVGWQIDSVGEVGEEGHYRMRSVDNRLAVRLTPEQQTALRRAALVVDRADLATRLGLPPGEQDAVPTAVLPTATDTSVSRCVDAVRLGSLLRFRYNGRGRVVHPQSLRVRGTTWYLYALEDGDDTLKAFVVTRMSDVEADAPGTATRPEVARHPGLDPMSWEVDEPTEVTLRAPEEFVPDVRRWLGTPLSETPGPDGVDLVLRVTHRVALRSRVYLLGTRVRVIGPPDVRQEILDELALMAGE